MNQKKEEIKDVEQLASEREDRQGEYENQIEDLYYKLGLQPPVEIYEKI